MRGRPIDPARSGRRVSDLLVHGGWAAQAALAASLALVPLALRSVPSRGVAPAPVVAAALRRKRGVDAGFVAPVTVAVASGAAVTAQERGLRAGTAAAPEGFALVVAAPGSQVDATLAAVFLQPRATGLLDARTMEALPANPRIRLAAPLAFGDGHDGAPVVGTTRALLDALAGPVAEGRAWERPSEAVAGASAEVALGAPFSPDHGHGAGAIPDAHAEVQVVGRMAPTGTPWDRAIVTSVETVWLNHGRGIGDGEALGPPWRDFPGTPAVVVRAESLAAAWALRQSFERDDAAMAFFPAEGLAGLHRVMGDLRGAASVMGAVTQLLVAAAVLLALAILARLDRRRLAMLRAPGAPRRFAMAAAWGRAAAILASGTVIGLGLGPGVAWMLGAAIEARTGIAVPARPGWREAQWAAGFLAICSLAALLPTWRASRAPVVEALRG